MSERQDLLAALLGRVEFELDGRRFVMPVHPVTTWMDAVLDGQPDAVVPRLLQPADARYLYDRLLDGEQSLDLQLCESIGLWVTEAVGGRAWWEVRRALSWSLDGWNSFDGWARHEAGVDPLALPVRSFVNLFVRFALIATGENSEGWLAEFEAPPLAGAAGMEIRPEWADESVEADFSDAFDSFATLTGGQMPD